MAHVPNAASRAALARSQPSLDGEVVLVTGAGRGLGREIALAAADAGAHVALVSRTRSELDAVASAVADAGGHASVATCDVTDRMGFSAVLDQLPLVTVLVNNAGINIPEPFADVAAETFDQIMDANVRSLYFCTQAVVRRLTDASRPGVIINVSSQMGHVGAPNRSVYCAAKHAIEGLTKALAVELAPKQIRVNAVAPTYVHTPMTEAFLADPEFRSDALRRIPLGRFASPEDIAAAVVFLACQQAGMVTGTSLLIDGGYTAQ